MMRSARERTSRGSTPSVAAISATRILANNMPTIGRSSERSRDEAASIASASGMGLAGGDGVDRGQEHIDGRVLGDDRVSLRQRGRHGEDVIHVGGVQDDAGWSRSLLEPEAGAQAVTASQRVVEHHHVGPIATQCTRELSLGRDGAEQPVARLLVEQLLQPGPQGGVVLTGRQSRWYTVDR
jgi:hypothetical protein